MVLKRGGGGMGLVLLLIMLLGKTIGRWMKRDAGEEKAAVYVTIMISSDE